MGKEHACSRNAWGGTSAIRGGFLKRMNRTIRLISKNFLSPFIELYYTTQCELNSETYGEPDLFFRVATAAGMVAREHENQVLGALIQFMPPQTPGFWAIVQQIVENTSAKDKDVMTKAIQASAAALPAATRARGSRSPSGHGPGSASGTTA